MHAAAVQRFVPPLAVKLPPVRVPVPLTGVEWAETLFPLAPIVIVRVEPVTLEVETSYVLLDPMVRPLIVPTPPIVIVPLPLLVETVIVPGLLGAWLNVIAMVSPFSIEADVPPALLNTTVLMGVKRSCGVNVTVGDVHGVAEVA